MLKKTFLSLALALSTPSFADPIKVGIVLDKGGKDDRSFNAAAYAGGMRAQKELGIEVKAVEATDDNAFEPTLRKMAEKKFDLIVSVGFAQAEAVGKVAQQFPSSRFAIVDAEVKQPNVRSILFEEHQGSFLVGAIAALTSKTGKVGFVGGMDIPLIRRFQMGYEAGAKYANPKADVKTNYTGVTGEAWNNPAKAKELAAAQYEAGADVVFAAAGASNLGVFDAAEERKKLAIGVDSNQNWIKPGFILTSMLKRVDEAVFKTCGDLKGGKFTPGVARYGLENGGIDFAVDQHNSKVLAKPIIEKVNSFKAQILKGEIQVPDYYKLGKKS